MMDTDRFVWPERIFGPGVERMTEVQFEGQIKSIAGYCGFVRILHLPYARGMPVGFPDLMMVRVDERAPTVAYFEVKGPKGQVKQKQLDWLADLRRAGHHAYLVQPKDYLLVTEILRNVYDPPEPGTGNIDAAIKLHLSMDQDMGMRI